MPLTTESYTLDEAIDELQGRIEDVGDTIADLEETSDRYQRLEARSNRLEYLCDGLVWQRDEAEWGGDCEITLGALTAGEKALMHRAAPDEAGREEMNLWFVAQGTVDAPYAADDLDEAFADLAGAHDGYVQWAEAKLNGLASPGESGNRLRTYLQGKQDGKSSTSERTSTT